MRTTGGFTLPGEAGCEALTLRLAERWGADVIRDSDGTQLSDAILNAGYEIYSTICPIRGHNTWAKEHPDMLQQCFLCTLPCVPAGERAEIPLTESFFSEQFRINDSQDALRLWQVFDRTEDRLLDRAQWAYEKDAARVVVRDAVPFHSYTVSFLCYRVWEEISMYNHVTNGWTEEHLMPIDPIYPEAQEYLLRWMDEWCAAHPATGTVRFTSLFYNFVWIWGAHERDRSLFTDWASYDFTVSPRALALFEREYGYALTAEDFVNGGALHPTHMPGTPQKADWMAFVGRFVRAFGRKLVDIVHAHGKKAFVFYDDSWVGLEPYSGSFGEFGFDGLIKCVFSGYEARLCAGVDVPVHELRLHPYLFPTGLGGAPTFMEGGDPAADAMEYWLRVRRALLRAPIDRIGLGGYLHLTEAYPDFVDAVAHIADEFRAIAALHREGAPWCMKPRVAVLHHWGRLRSWSLSGHFHETDQNDLIHLNEALAGLPFEVEFLNFDDVLGGALQNIDVVLNAGFAGSAWSGGGRWTQPAVVEAVIRFVHEGGTFIGVGEPSAVEGRAAFFRMAPALGVDEDTGARQCHGKWRFSVDPCASSLPEGSFVRPRSRYMRGIPFLTDGAARVYKAEAGLPTLTAHAFGVGAGVYFASFENTPENARLLFEMIVDPLRRNPRPDFWSDDPMVECAWFPACGKLAVVNNGVCARQAAVSLPGGCAQTVLLQAHELRIMTLER